MQKSVDLGNTVFSNEKKLVLIAGPCVLETYEHAKMMTESLLEITSRLKIDFVYKTSFDKANRTSINSCLLYTSPSPRDRTRSRMPSSA